MSETQPELYIDEKWDKVIDVMVKRTLTGVFAGAVGGFLLFRPLWVLRSMATAGGSPARIATSTFGMGLGVGSAFQLCNKEFKEIFLPKQ